MASTTTFPSFVHDSSHFNPAGVAEVPEPSFVVSTADLASSTAGIGRSRSHRRLAARASVQDSSASQQQGNIPRAEDAPYVRSSSGIGRFCMPNAVPAGSVPAAPGMASAGLPHAPASTGAASFSEQSAAAAGQQPTAPAVNFNIGANLANTPSFGRKSKGVGRIASASKGWQAAVNFTPTIDLSTPLTAADKPKSTTIDIPGFDHLTKRFEQLMQGEPAEAGLPVGGRAASASGPLPVGATTSNSSSRHATAMPAAPPVTASAPAIRTIPAMPPAASGAAGTAHTHASTTTPNIVLQPPVSAAPPAAAAVAPIAQTQAAPTAQAQAAPTSTQRRPLSASAYRLLAGLQGVTPDSRHSGSSGQLPSQNSNLQGSGFAARPAQPSNTTGNAPASNVDQAANATATKLSSSSSSMAGESTAGLRTSTSQVLPKEPSVANTVDARGGGHVAHSERRAAMNSAPEFVGNAMKASGKGTGERSQDVVGGKQQDGAVDKQRDGSGNREQTGPALSTTAAPVASNFSIPAASAGGSSAAPAQDAQPSMAAATMPAPAADTADAPTFTLGKAEGPSTPGGLSRQSSRRRAAARALSSPSAAAATTTHQPTPPPTPSAAPVPNIFAAAATAGTASATPPVAFSAAASTPGSDASASTPFPFRPHFHQQAQAASTAVPGSTSVLGSTPAQQAPANQPTPASSVPQYSPMAWSPLYSTPQQPAFGTPMPVADSLQPTATSFVTTQGSTPAVPFAFTAAVGSTDPAANGSGTPDLAKGVKHTTASDGPSSHNTAFPFSQNAHNTAAPSQPGLSSGTMPGAATASAFFTSQGVPSTSSSQQQPTLHSNGTQQVGAGKGGSTGAKTQDATPAAGSSSPPGGDTIQAKDNSKAKPHGPGQPPQQARQVPPEVLQQQAAAVFGSCAPPAGPQASTTVPAFLFESAAPTTNGAANRGTAKQQPAPVFSGSIPAPVFPPAPAGATTGPAFPPPAAATATILVFSASAPVPAATSAGPVFTTQAASEAAAKLAEPSFNLGTAGAPPAGSSTPTGVGRTRSRLQRSASRTPGRSFKGRDSHSGAAHFAASSAATTTGAAAMPTTALPGSMPAAQLTAAQPSSAAHVMPGASMVLPGKLEHVLRSERSEAIPPGPQTIEERLAAERAARSQAQLQKANTLKVQGNELYAVGKYQESESAYTAALEALGEAQASSTDMAVLHSNRAGARLMIGKPMSALSDAQRAVSLDPKFFRAISRAATCHCRMGDFSSAQRVLDKGLDRLSASSRYWNELDKKMKEVKDTRAQVADASAQLLAADNTLDKLQAGLDILARVQPLVVYSEPVAALRAACLLAAGRFTDAVAACDVSYQAPDIVTKAPWRLWLQAQAKYMAGDMQAAISQSTSLVEALSRISHQDAVTAAAAEGEAAAFGGTSNAALAGLGLRLPTITEVAGMAETARKLLTLKEDGNTAIKAKQHQQAVEKYTAGLAMSPPPAFAAVLHGNRAAAHQGLGSIVEAIADCVRAKALDPAYLRAITRLASLLQEVKKAEAAQRMLEAVLKSDSGVPMSASDKSSITTQAAAAKETASWQSTADHYQLLGVERTCTEDEVRKAYRKAALKHHPDKAVAACRYSTAVPLGDTSNAGQAPQAAADAVASCLAHSHGGPCVTLLGINAAIEKRLREEANWLFNLINTAHEELSDKSKRKKVDMLLATECAPSMGYRTGSSGFYSSYHNSSHNYGAYDAYGSTYGSTFRTNFGSGGARPSAANGYANPYGPSSRGQSASSQGNGTSAQGRRAGAAGSGGSFGGSGAQRNSAGGRRPAQQAPPSGRTSAGANGGNARRPQQQQQGGTWSNLGSDDEDYDYYYY